MIIICGKLFSENFTDKNRIKRTAIKICITKMNFAGNPKKQKSDIPPGLEGMMNPPAYDEEDYDLPF